MLDTLRQDVRYALRRLRRSPGFAVVAVLTVALGVGATTAVFSAVQGVLLRPLPYRQPDRLVRIVGYRTDEGPDAPSTPVSLRNFLDWSEMTDAFEGMAAYNEWTADLRLSGRALRLEGAEVTPGFFQVLGVEPAVGRFFDMDDPDSDMGQVVLAHGFWKERFGGDPAVVGRPLTLDGKAYTVVGVTGAGFEDPGLSAYGPRPAFWRVTPRLADPSGTPRSSRQFTAIARLAAGTTRKRVGREMEAVMGRLAREYPDAVTGRGVRLVPLKDDRIGAVRPTLLALFGAVGILLLIACANLANLFLGRAAERRRELALRASLGASRTRLVRQLLTESLVVATCGGVLGVALADVALRALLAAGGAGLPRAEGIGLHVPVLLFAIVVTWGTGLVFGLAPVVQLWRSELRDMLVAGGPRSTDGRGRGRLQSGLVVTQMALAVTLLVGAGLLVRSLWTLQGEDPGFRADHVLAVQIAPPATKYGEQAEIDALHQTLHRRLGALPGVHAVASVSILPMGNNYIGFRFQVEDRPPPEPGTEPTAAVRTVTPGYFETIGTPLLHGRPFHRSDREDAPRVVIVSRSLARRWWPGSSAVGRRITMRGVSWTIVGVASDAREESLGEPPEPSIYIPFAQSPGDWLNRNADLVLRTTVPPEQLVPAVRDALRSVDSSIPVLAVRPLERIVAATTAAPRFRTLLLGTFAAFALLLGAVGVFGVLAYRVTRQRRALAIRVAVGARGLDIVGLVLGRGLALVAAGAAAGILGALATGRVLASLLYGIRPTDPVTFAAVTLLVLTTGVVACWLPARRAARADPMTILRSE